MQAHKAHVTTDEEISRIDVWVVEDDNAHRDAVEGLLNQTKGMRCRHALRTCNELFHVLEKEYAPEVVLLDIELPGLSSIEGIKRLREVSPATDVLMLTTHEEDAKVFEAICAGARGYLLKSLSGEALLDAICGVLAGGAPMNAHIARKVLQMFNHLAPAHPDYGLTEREKEILGLMTDGLAKRAIADKLFVSFFTIDTHVKHIYGKLHVHSGTGAVAKVLRERLLA